MDTCQHCKSTILQYNFFLRSICWMVPIYPLLEKDHRRGGEEEGENHLQVMKRRYFPLGVPSYS